MTGLIINDLKQDIELDRKAMAKLNGRGQPSLGFHNKKKKKRSSLPNALGLGVYGITVEHA